MKIGPHRDGHDCIAQPRGKVLVAVQEGGSGYGLIVSVNGLKAGPGGVIGFGCRSRGLGVEYNYKGEVKDMDGGD
jgi:hypothetical protein